MSRLAEHASEYLRMRRGLGFKLERHGQLLESANSHARIDHERRGGWVPGTQA